MVVYICSCMSYLQHFASCDFYYLKQSVLVYSCQEIISEILSFRWTFPNWGLEIVQRSLWHTLIHFVLFRNRAQMGWGDWRVARGRRWEKKKIIRLFSHNKAKRREDKKFSYQCWDKAQCLQIVASLDAWFSLPLPECVCVFYVFICVEQSDGGSV